MISMNHINDEFYMAAHSAIQFLLYQTNSNLEPDQSLAEDLESFGLVLGSFWAGKRTSRNKID